MEVVAVEQCDFDAQKAYDAAAAIIESNPDIVGNRIAAMMIWRLEL